MSNLNDAQNVKILVKNLNDTIIEDYFNNHNLFINNTLNYDKSSIIYKKLYNFKFLKKILQKF